MPRRQARNQFDNLTHAALDGSAADVRRLIATGTHPDDRDEAKDPTPLMAAAARGRLDVVKVLVHAGADVNAVAEDHTGELDQFPFLDELFATGRLSGLSPLVAAALYGQEQVYHYLAPRTAALLRREAEAIQAARVAQPGFVPRPYLEPEKPPSTSQRAREALLADSAAARRWVVQCPLCRKQGYKPTMPAEIDRCGTAAQVRKLFRPMALEDYLCPRCGEMLAAARRKMAARKAKRTSSD
jgi:hypothetical protein